MPIQAPYFRFTGDEITTNAPDAAGVYALEEVGDVLHYGSSTESVRSRLQAHKNGDESACTQNAGWFRTELNSNPRARERQLLQENQREHGRLPKCNSVIPFFSP